MAKLKEIKIFLGSSIVEFEHERNEFKNFIFDMSAKFEKSYNTKLIPLMCEDVDPCYADEPTQNIINRMVLSSDLCFFIFFTKAGEFTQLEFDIAKTQFEKTKKPKIYLYFKELGENKPEQSLIDFKTYYEETLKQYTPKPFVHIDTIKLRLLQTLNETAFDGVLDIKPDGNKILVDGNEMFSTENIAEFANNVLFKKLTDELQQADARYAELDGKFRNRLCTPEEETEYFEVAPKRRKLENQIDELRKNIFNMSLRMCRDEIRGEITQRQREAYRLFEAGDLEEANRILNDKDITKAYQQDKADRKEEQKIKTRAYIGELRTKIEILTVMPNITKFKEIEKLYDTIVPEAFEQKVEIDVIHDFAWFLYDQNKHQKAYKTAKQLEALISADNQAETADLYHLLATISDEFPAKKDEAIEYYNKAIAIYKKLAKTNPDRFEPDLADSYNNAGIFYKTHGQPQKAEDFYNKAIALREKSANTNPDRFEPDLATSYNNAGNFYQTQGQPQKAEKFYNKAIANFEKLAKSNPDRFEPDLANSYNNAGDFYMLQNNYDKAKCFSDMSINIYEKLAKSNPDRFEPDLAVSYYTYAEITKDNTFFKKAHNLAKKHPYNPYCRQIIEELKDDF